ncbi:MAG: hypothetical protein MJ108_05495 [Saccharofermentans sp.]|nr:hypothetical protein [Saccharofermentans sp.]
MTEENYENNSNGSYPFEFDSTENSETNQTTDTNANVSSAESAPAQTQEVIQAQTSTQVQTQTPPPPPPPPAEPQHQEYARTEPADQNMDSKKKGNDFRKSVSDYALSMYSYAAGVKNKGHISLADLMLKDLMTIIMSTNTASDSIGREKFTQMLEEGYYASSRMIEYMKFLNSMNVRNNMYEPLLEENERIHRVFAASLKTTRAKARTYAVGM